MKIPVWLELLRPFTLIYPFIAVFSGGVMSGIITWRLFLASITASLINGASNVINQYCDIDVDRINKPYRPLPSGRVSKNFAVLYGIFLYMIGLIFAWVAGFWFFLLSLIASVLTISYSVPPVRIKARGFLGNLVLSITRGLIPVIAGWSVGKDLVYPQPWAVGIILSLFVFGANTSKDFSDIKGDKAYGIKTIPVIYGNLKAVEIMRPFLVFPFFLVPLFVWFGFLNVLTLPLIFLSVWGFFISRNLLKNPEKLSLERNHPSWIHMYLIMMIFVLYVAFTSLVIT